MLLLDEPEIRALVTPAEAMAACREAYAQLKRGEVVQPDVLSFDLVEQHGDAHAKGAYLKGTPYFSIKVATGFYDNPRRGLPALGGAVWVFSAETGQLAAMLMDNGYLTDLRTGAAGGLAADWLAPAEIDTVAMLGAGAQARQQLAALLSVRAPKRVRVWSRTRVTAQAFAADALQAHGLIVDIRDQAEWAVRGADVIITTTPARAAYVDADWVQPGAHITAVGSDMPDKQELDPQLLAKATVVVDRIQQAMTQGELHHALEAGLMTPEAVYAEMGDLALGRKPGRTRADEITVADFTGVGALDAAMANLVTGRALARGIGRRLEV